MARGKGTYSPLEEVELGTAGAAANGASTSGSKWYDSSYAELEAPSDARLLDLKRRRLKTTWSVIGGVGAVLLVLAIVTSVGDHGGTLPVVMGPQPPSPDQNSMGRDYGLGGSSEFLDQDYSTTPGFHKCTGPELECGIIHTRPVPQVDFRNLSRLALADNGMVAADNSRCSQTGRDVLEAGGNAVDAAVATAFCQGVVNPIASGIGGGAFMLVRLANGTAEFIDSRETAPANATADMFDDLPASAPLDGGLAIAIPNELRGLETAWKRYGKLPWERLVQPAANLARTGFGAHPYLVYVLSGPSNFARIKATPALRDSFLINNGTDWRVPYPGERCCQRLKLADTLDNIAKKGASWLYSAENAATLAAEIRAAGGIMTAEDIMSASAAVVPALTAPLGQHTLVFPPPPSSAAVVAFALRFLEGYADGGMNNKEPELSTHRLVEAMKHGFAVRVHLGDTGAPPGPHAPNITADVNAAISDLLSDTFTDQLRAITKDNGVLPDDRYGGRWNPLLKDVEAPPDDHGTTHFCVVDKDRNAVSMTSTVNTVFGSMVVSPTFGIVLNNEMDDFSLPKNTSFVTPHPSPNNFIAPGKRPLSAMSPTAVLDAATGRLQMVTGASGGPLIVSATLQTLARVLLLGEPLDRAVNLPRVHDQLLPNSVWFEDFTWGHVGWQLTNATKAFLAQGGDKLTSVPAALGISQAIVVDPVTGSLQGCSDARKDGAPLGY